MKRHYQLEPFKGGIQGSYTLVHHVLVCNFIARLEVMRLYMRITSLTNVNLIELKNVIKN